MTNWLDGKKTYLSGALAIATGLALAYFGIISAGEAAGLIAIGLTAFGLRDAIGKLIAERAAEIAQEKGAARRMPPGVSKLPPDTGTGGPPHP